MREARARDALPILGLHRAILDERRWFITRPDEFAGTVAGKEQLIRQMADGPSSICLVAQLPRVPLAGFLTVTGGVLGRMSHTGKLEIMVAREHRGAGVGRRLVEACLEWAEATPAIEKIGLSVFADNARAIELYRRFGFNEEGRRQREYRMADGSYRDDLLLCKFV